LVSIESWYVREQADRAHELSDVETARDEIRRQAVEELRIARRVPARMSSTGSMSPIPRK
jgi:hypothetical protein